MLNSSPNQSATDSLDDPSQEQEVKLSFSFLITCLILACIKLWLVGENEIIARQMPHDQLWFIKAADHLIHHHWLGPYDNLTLIRQPLYPVWIWLNHSLGLPLRLSHEILLLLSGFTLAAVLVKSRLPRLLAVLVFLLVTAHPYSFILNNEVLAEAFYTPLLLLSLSGLVMMSLSRRRPRSLLLYSILSGLSLALLWNTRHENALIIVLLGFYFLYEFFVLWKQNQSWKAVGKPLASIVLIPVLCIALLSAAIKTINYLKYDLFAASEMFAPGFNAAAEALLRIKQEHPRRYVPVPKEVREIAYSISPSFQQLKPTFEGEIGKNWIKEGCANNKVCDDFSGGWFHFALRDAVREAGQYQTAPRAEAFYFRIADEIDQACRERKIQCIRSGRGGLLTYFPPSSETYLPFLGRSFLNVTRLFFLSWKSEVKKDDFNSTPTEVQNIFNKTADRRAELIKPLPLMIEGWSFHLKDPITKVYLRTKSGDLLADEEKFYERPDVVDHFSQKGISVSPSIGFRLNIPSDLRRPPSEMQIVFATKSGKELSFPTAPGIYFNEPLGFSIDSIQEMIPPQTLKSRIQELIGEIYGPFIVILTGIALTALLVFPWLLRGTKISDPAFLILFLMAVIIISRLAVAVWLDASSFSVFKCPRILYPVMGLYGAFLLILTYQSFSLLTTRFPFIKKKLTQTGTFFLHLPKLIKNEAADPNSSFLVDFSRKHIVLICLLFASFLLLTFFHLHGFSITMWKSVIEGLNPNEGIIGQAQQIRSDDWMVTLPLIFSQTAASPSFPVINPLIGEGQNMLISVPVPVFHWISLFRPQLWGYFLNPDFGLAWHWWFRVFGLFYSFFLVFMLISRNQFYLSFFAAVVLLFSPFHQFWSFCMEPVSIFTALGFISFAYILFSLSRKFILLHSLLFAWSLGSLLLCLYPPFIIPLGYLLGFMCLGWFLSRRKRWTGMKMKAFRFGALSAALLFAGFCFLVFYGEAKDVYQIAMNTEYPGKRLTQGGRYPLWKLFSNGFIPFWEIQNWGKFLNISEAGSFLFFFPPIILAFIWEHFRKRKIIDFFSFAILLYISLFLLWLFIGLPEPLAKYSLLNRVVEKRGVIGLGTADLILLVSFLSKPLSDPSPLKRGGIVGWITIPWLALMIALGFEVQKILPEISESRIVLISFFFGLLGFAFLRKKRLSIAVLALFSIYLSGWFNPWVRGGLSYLRENPLSKKIIELDHKAGGKSLWAVFSDLALPNLPRVLGVKSLGGYQFYPQFEIWSVLDPVKKSTYNYNRSGDVVFLISQEKDSIQFSNSPGTINASVHPENSAFLSLGADYLLYTGPYGAFLDQAENLKWEYSFKDKHIYKIFRTQN